jgi:undecaprenyl-diphosphatase
MDLIQAILLGLVEGITEYLPVSSTGHLLIAQRLLGIEQSVDSNGYAIAIQAGAIVAVLGIYRQRVAHMLQGLMGRNPEGLRLALCVMAAFLPAGVLALLFDERIEQHLFGVKPVIAAWVVGGIAILALSRWIEARRNGLPLTALRWQSALLIGLFQCVAMWPGTSRSLVTILGGLVVGLSLSAAVEFAFLLGVLTLGAAAAYTALKHGDGMIAAYGWPALLAGFVTAWVSAAIAVKWMVGYLNRHGLAIFAWWRFAAAGLAALLLVANVSAAESTQGLTKELAGTELTYHYEGGRRYQVRFSADTISWLRLDVPGRSWEGPVPYVARKIGPDRYFVNWRRPELTEFITVYYDFGEREMYTSALLEGGVRHFESARIVELKRP